MRLSGEGCWSDRRVQGTPVKPALDSKCGSEELVRQMPGEDSSSLKWQSRADGRPGPGHCLQQGSLHMLTGSQGKMSTPNTSSQAHHSDDS